ncbi:uncharacterized protein DAT39_014226, partial [Clarias magur]
CFFFTFLLVIYRVSSQNVRVVNGTLGGTVILPCSTSQRNTNVYWRYGEKTTVCDIIAGEVDFEEQDAVYKDRVESFPIEFAKGNFSIKLKKLKKSDEGIYTCNFPRILTPDTLKLIVTVNLKDCNCEAITGTWSRPLFISVILNCALAFTVADLLVCCGAAESFTEKSVDLGQNVTLKCEVSVNNVLWFLMKPPEPPVFILRTFSSKHLVPQYSDAAFSKTFSLRYNSSLFIHNISTNELGVYYCSQTQTGSPPNISRGIRLYIQNHSAVNLTEDTKQVQNQTDCNYEVINSWSRPLFVSVILNCALAVTVAVLIGSCCAGSNSLQSPNSNKQQPSGSQ